jgi:N-methylhydantoinase A/acetophenone carboxylase
MKRASINIDIGGTFTDCVIAWGDKLARGKAPTTYYNVSIGFTQAIDEACKEIGVSLSEVLENTDIVRYGTTISMNTLIQRIGPKVGLFITEGFEDTTLIGRAFSWADGLLPQQVSNKALVKKPEPIVPRELIVGIKERVDCFGNVVRPLDRQDVVSKLGYLVDQGVTAFAVCLLWSVANPSHEKTIRKIIEEEYPDEYLGSFPVMLSSDIAPVEGEYERAMTVVLCAYLQRDLSDELHGLGERLRGEGYKFPLILTHSTGASASVSRTSSVETYGSGPVAGLFGCQYLCRLYGIDNVVATDMGGTSFDFGFVVDKSASIRSENPIVERFRVSLPVIEVRSIGAGGGSIAWTDEVGILHVGPLSAGAFPGPVCYDQGGTEPTVTDANVVLGYINPDYFLGGRIRLNKELAVNAIKEKVAAPMKMEVEEAALAIREVVAGRMANEVYNEVLLRGFDPRDFTIFAYGGAGPSHCCDYAAYLGDLPIYTFDFDSVLSALGMGTMPFASIYSASKLVVLHNFMMGQYLSDYEQFNKEVEHLVEKAYRDLKYEGFSRDKVSFHLELSMRYGASIMSTVIAAPTVLLRSEEDVKALCDLFEEAWTRKYSKASAYPEGGVEVTRFTLGASAPVPELRLRKQTMSGKAPIKAALKGKRPIHWSRDRFIETPIYDWDLLGCGNILEGPVIVEAADTTYVVPEGKRLTIDKYHNAKIESLK